MKASIGAQESCVRLIQAQYLRDKFGLPRRVLQDVRRTHTFKPKPPHPPSHAHPTQPPPAFLMLDALTSLRAHVNKIRV